MGPEEVTPELVRASIDEATLASRFLSGPTNPATDAPARVPARPGYYAIYGDDAGHLPSPYCDLLIGRGTDLLYIGIATVTLHGRLVEQDLRHERPSTFFRGIGPILGYRPHQGSLVGKANQNNYGLASLTRLQSFAGSMSIFGSAGSRPIQLSEGRRLP